MGGPSGSGSSGWGLHGPALCGMHLEDPWPSPARRQHRGHTLPEWGAWPQGAPFPCSIAHWLRPKRALRGGVHWLGVSRGAHVHSKTLSQGSLERHSLTSVARDPDQAPWPGNPATEAERGQGRLPGPTTLQALPGPTTLQTLEEEKPCERAKRKGVRTNRKERWR